METSDNPNEKLTPIYIGETLVWVTLTEYYRRHFGKVAIDDIE